MTKIALTLALSLSVCFLVASTSDAMSPFKKAFDETYVKSSGDDDYKASFKKLSCYTCHVKGEKKDWLNAYGKELALLIEGSAKERLDEAKKKGADQRTAENEALLKELKEAFKKVEAKKSPAGATFGELFEAHKLPTAEGAGPVE